MKSLFCWVYKNWLRYAVDSKDDPLVKVIDYVFGSNCKYCMVIRAVVFGVGAGLLFSFWVIGLMLMAGAVAMTLGEKYWLCD